MQAQPDIPPDMICKDKSLVQCAMDGAGTTQEDITSAMFAEDGKYVEEKSLSVIPVSPPNSPVLSPVSERLKQVRSYETLIPEEQNPNSIENFSPRQTVIEDVKETKMDVAEDLKPIMKENTRELLRSIDVVHEKKDDLISKMVKDLKVVKDIKGYKSLNVVESKIMDGDELKLVKEIEEVSQKKEALASTSETVPAKLAKFNSITLSIDSAKEDIHIDSQLIEEKSSVLKTIFDCWREAGEQLVLKIDGEEEIPLKSLFYFLHQDKLQEDIARNPYDIYGLLLVADKYCAISCIKECSKLLRGLDMIEEVSRMYLDPWSILMMNDAVNYRMIKSAKKFFMDKYKDIERFPADVKTSLTSLEVFLVDKFSEIQRTPEKFGQYLVEAVLQSDKIQADSEDEVYDVLMQWSKVYYPHEEQRIKFLSERIYGLVRFIFMSRQKLLEAKDYWLGQSENYWQGNSIYVKLAEGLGYQIRSLASTRDRFLDYKTKKHKYNEAVLEAAARKPYEQLRLDILEVKEDYFEIVEERVYKRRPIRILFKRDYFELVVSCCVYMELKREHCSTILVDGKCDSQVFYPFKGVQGFVLSARCIEGKGLSTFGLFLERYEEGPERIEFDCRFHIFSKNDDVNNDYSLMSEARYTGRPISCTDLLPWMDLMDVNSPFFSGWSIVHES